MPLVRVVCDRCKKNIQGWRAEDNSVTSGFYEVFREPWSKYARGEEREICDACMWNDPGYSADYVYQPKDAA